MAEELPQGYEVKLNKKGDAVTSADHVSLDEDALKLAGDYSLPTFLLRRTENNRRQCAWGVDDMQLVKLN